MPMTATSRGGGRSEYRARLRGSRSLEWWRRARRCGRGGPGGSEACRRPRIATETLMTFGVPIILLDNLNLLSSESRIRQVSIPGPARGRRLQRASDVESDLLSIRRHRCSAGMASGSSIRALRATMPADLSGSFGGLRANHRGQFRWKPRTSFAQP
jgi:hypothetical protein